MKNINYRYTLHFKRNFENFRSILTYSVERYLFISLLYHPIVPVTVKQPSRICIKHDGIIKWKIFPCYWPFVGGIHQSLVDSPHSGHWSVALIFSLMCAWINAGHPAEAPVIWDAIMPMWRHCNVYHNSLCVTLRYLRPCITGPSSISSTAINDWHSRTWVLIIKISAILHWP